jgi:hypothetical protein
MTEKGAVVAESGCLRAAGQKKKNSAAQNRLEAVVNKVQPMSEATKDWLAEQH